MVEGEFKYISSAPNYDVIQALYPVESCCLKDVHPGAMALEVCKMMPYELVKDDCIHSNNIKHKYTNG